VAQITFFAGLVGAMPRTHVGPPVQKRPNAQRGSTVLLTFLAILNLRMHRQNSQILPPHRLINFVETHCKMRKIIVGSHAHGENQIAVLGRVVMIPRALMHLDRHARTQITRVPIIISVAARGATRPIPVAGHVLEERTRSVEMVKTAMQMCPVLPMDCRRRHQT